MKLTAGLSSGKVAIDGTGFSKTNPSFHYLKRIDGANPKNYTKLSALLDLKTKKFFIAATHQNDGKTTVSLGLIYCLKKLFKKIGFIKPVGQRYLIEQGYKVDEDSILIDYV